mmetsp:Transcript_8140/g.20386  ORF Transcript_8140/g.20386 Transcript_8140/m.20386 type:complete len:221 (+) Transcript_8140:1070-1732(+)
MLLSRHTWICNRSPSYFHSAAHPASDFLFLMTASTASKELALLASMGAMQVPTFRLPLSALAPPFTSQSTRRSRSGWCANLNRSVSSQRATRDAAAAGASGPSACAASSTFSAFARASARSNVPSSTPMRRPLPRSMRTMYLMSCASARLRRRAMIRAFCSRDPAPETPPNSRSPWKSSRTVSGSASALVQQRSVCTAPWFRPSKMQCKVSAGSCWRPAA